MGNAIAVTGDRFETEVLKSTEPVLVDFWAVWCGPCRAIAPAVEEIATEFKGRLKVVKVDVDENQDIAVKYSVLSIPTLIVFKNGQAVDRMVGAPPNAKGVLTQKVKANQSEPASSNGTAG
jgi:thioredoxin 1